MKARLYACLAACVPPAWCQPQPPGAAELLAKIRAAVAENLSRLPNYTCSETIQRSSTPRNILKSSMLETVHLQVAYVEGKEFFGWPGGNIDQPEITKLIGGSAGNGYFGLFSKAIFSTREARIEYFGPEQMSGKQTIRFDYRIEKRSATYRLSTPLGQVVTGYHGSFWADPATFELRRLTVEADDPPKAIGIAATSSTMEFEPKAIGNSTFDLPRSAELLVVDLEGNAEHSRLTFSGCHQFVGESVIRFDDAEAQAPPAAAPVSVALTLPEDFTTDFTLDTPIDWETNGTGDAVRGVLRDGVRDQGRTIVPKGAKLTGRIVHLALRDGLYYVEIAFTSLDFPGSHADLDGRRNGVSVNNMPLIYPTTRFKLTRGVHLTLHSRLLKSEKHDSIRP